MLKNERQYRIAKAQIHEIEGSLGTLASNLISVENRGRFIPLQEREKSLRARLEVLRRDLEEYEQLRTGKQGHRIFRRLGNLEELPRNLIMARIAAGLTQRELAQRLGLKPQQVQHYEATDYASASLSRVLEIAKVLGACG